jgi:Fe-S-cluster-containing dehydrogenase component
MFEWLWAMNTNQLLVYSWLCGDCFSCCVACIDYNENRYDQPLRERHYRTIVEKIDKIERKLEDKPR